ncbi:UNVERIFIED_CONTAM: hypothetical protein HDU68_004873 [Siphonaria sp. JEL0065]|nr:hypothetical protein HDU68_004873 [Siphonaria sp. JEL0065]
MAVALSPTDVKSLPTTPLSPKPVPKQLADAITRAEALAQTDPAKAMPLFFGSAKALWPFRHHNLTGRALSGLISVLTPFFASQTHPADLTPAQIKETLFQAQFALARITAPIDPAQSLILYSDSLSTKFKSVDMKKLQKLVKSPSLLIQSASASLPGTDVLLSKLLLHCSEASRVGLIHRFHPNGLQLAIASATLVSLALLKANKVHEFIDYWKYCCELSIMLLGDFAPIEWLIIGSRLLTQNDDSVNSFGFSLSDSILVEAFTVAVDVGDYVKVKTIVDVMKGLRVQQIVAFVIKLGESICNQDDAWLEYEASFELSAALDDWRIPRQNQDSGLPSVNYLPSGIESTQFNLPRALHDALALSLCRLHGA